MRTFIPDQIGYANVDVNRGDTRSGGAVFAEPGPYHGLRAEHLSIQPRYLSDLPGICVRHQPKTSVVFHARDYPQIRRVEPTLCERSVK